ncbi:MAG: response regulator [Candidatus Omnitrophota bacterium]
MLKLLVVDDERDICDFVKNFFKERDFDVLMAYNGKEALEIIEREKPDIILLDMKMPTMNGFETLKKLKGKGIKVIMVTAIEDEEKAKEAKLAGAIEYITKPLMLEQLERTVFIVAEQIKMEG